MCHLGRMPGESPAEPTGWGGNVSLEPGDGLITELVLGAAALGWHESKVRLGGPLAPTVQPRGKHGDRVEQIHLLAVQHPLQDRRGALVSQTTYAAQLKLAAHLGGHSALSLEIQLLQDFQYAVQLS